MRQERYMHFKVEDFVTDQGFEDWVLGRESSNRQFWERFQMAHPEKAGVIMEAKEIILSFQSEMIFVSKRHKKEIWKNIESSLPKEQRTPVRFFKYAAVFILLFSIGGLVKYLIDSQESEFNLASFESEEMEQAVLFLSDGSQIALDSMDNDVQYSEGGHVIEINTKKVVTKETDEEEQYNRIVVPFGHRSKISLADGTIVWLNAGSSMIYPVKFLGKRRKVRLRGEAFFEVTKDPSKPFIVSTEFSQIKVLGTSFNVSAYPDDKLEETVLVEGKISLTTSGTLFSKNEVILKPNQKARLREKGAPVNVSTVNVNHYIDWVEGVFVFDNESVPDVLKRLARYYNIKIRAERDLTKLHLRGKLDLKNDYEKVLKALTIIAPIHYVKESDSIIFKNLKKE